MTPSWWQWVNDTATHKHLFCPRGSLLEQSAETWQPPPGTGQHALWLFLCTHNRMDLSSNTQAIMKLSIQNLCIASLEMQMSKVSTAMPSRLKKPWANLHAGSYLSFTKTNYLLKLSQDFRGCFKQHCLDLLCSSLKGDERHNIARWTCTSLPLRFLIYSFSKENCKSYFLRHMGVL